MTFVYSDLLRAIFIFQISTEDLFRLEAEESVVQLWLNNDQVFCDSRHYKEISVTYQKFCYAHESKWEKIDFDMVFINLISEIDNRKNYIIHNKEKQEGLRSLFFFLLKEFPNEPPTKPWVLTPTQERLYNDPRIQRIYKLPPHTLEDLLKEWQRKRKTAYAKLMEITNKINYLKRHQIKLQLEIYQRESKIIEHILSVKNQRHSV